MELTLTPEIEIAINRQASQKGTTPEQIALDGLRMLFGSGTEYAGQPPTSLADFLDGYIGVIRSSEAIDGGAQLSENIGERFAQLMAQKRTQDHL